MSSMAINGLWAAFNITWHSRPKIRARFPEWTIRHEACLQEGRYRNATCKQSLTRSTSEHRSSWSSRIRCVQHLHPCTRIVKLTQDDSSLMARRCPPVQRTNITVSPLIHSELSPWRLHEETRARTFQVPVKSGLFVGARGLYLESC